MNCPTFLALLLVVYGCSYRHENDQSAQTAAFAKEDSILFAEVNNAPAPKARQIPLFNDVPKLRRTLGSVGIGEMRKWWNDGISWMSASNFYNIGSPGLGGMPGNLAFYLESPSEKYVQSLKVKVNINNMSEKKATLKKYAQTVERTFNVIGLDMPSGLKPALLAGKPYENVTTQRTIKNIFEPGNIDSWKLQVLSH